MLVGLPILPGGGMARFAESIVLFDPPTSPSPASRLLTPVVFCLSDIDHRLLAGPMSRDSRACFSLAIAVHAAPSSCDGFRLNWGSRLLRLAFPSPSASELEREKCARLFNWPCIHSLAARPGLNTGVLGNLNSLTSILDTGRPRPVGRRLLF